MIIDCHSHVWPSLAKLGMAGDFSCLAPGRSGKLPDSASADIERHRASSDPAQMTLVLGFVSNLLNAEIPNDFISRYVASDPGRLTGFAGVDPTSLGNLAEKLEQLQQEGNFAGITLSPTCQGFHPCHTRAMQLYEAAQKMAMPIYFLYGEILPSQAILDYSQPSALDEVARAFPDLKMIISHLGFPWVEQAIALLAKHPNIFADVAGLTDKPWQAYRSLTLAYEYGVMGKLLFASDFPSHTVKVAAESLYNLNKITLDSVLPAVPREQLRSIVERDSLPLLGLTCPKSDSPATQDTNTVPDQPESVASTRSDAENN